MIYNLKPAEINHPSEAEYYTALNNGYKLFEDENNWYSAFVGHREEPDPKTWATLNNNWERDMPIFTREYCEYEGIERERYDTIIVTI